MYQPFFERRFLLPLSFPDVSSTLFFFALVLLFFSVALFTAVPVLVSFYYKNRRFSISGNFLAAAIAMQLYIFLQGLRFVLSTTSFYCIMVNNIIVYGLILVFVLAAGLFWRGVVTTADYISSLYPFVAGDIALFFCGVGAFGFILTSASVYIRLSEAGFGAIFLIGMFLLYREVDNVLLKTVKRAIVTNILAITAMVILRYATVFRFPFGPEILLHAGSAIIGGFALSQLVYVVHNVSNRSYREHRTQVEEYQFFLQQAENMHLSKREREIVYLLLQGKNNREIAEQVVSSEKTIRNHLSTIYQKCEVRSRVELVLVFTRT